MRPNIAELLEGTNRTIMSTAICAVQRTGDRQGLMEIAAANRFMIFIQSRWQNEFSRLAGENQKMENLLTQAYKELKSHALPETGEIEKVLAKPRPLILDLPSVESLQESNNDLKKGLVIFIKIHSKTGNKDTAGLKKVRQNIRKFLKEITMRDYEEAKTLVTY
jgi:hypothetical protein